MDHQNPQGKHPFSPTYGRHRTFQSEAEKKDDKYHEISEVDQSKEKPAHRDYFDTIGNDCEINLRSLSLG